MDQIGYSIFIEHPDGSKELITGKRSNIKFTPNAIKHKLSGPESLSIMAVDSNG